MLVRFTAVFFLVALAGCSTIQNNGLDRSFLTLNSQSPEIRVGSVYVLENHRLTDMVDLLGSYGSTQWLVRNDYDMKNCALIGKTSFCPPGTVLYFVSASAYVEGGKVQSVKMADPFACLELLNRPTTGLNYNRTAEIRVNQWRASISRLISECDGAGNDTAKKVVLCTGIETLHSSGFHFHGYFVENDTPVIVRHFLERSKFSNVDLTHANNYSLRNGGASEATVPVSDSIIIGASFMVMSIVDGTTEPRIEFYFGSRVDVDALRSR